MKLAIIGSPETFESRSILKEARNYFQEIDRFRLSSLKFLVNDRPEVYFGDKEISSYYDVFLFRGVGRNITLAYLLAQIAYDQGRCIIDEKYVTKSNLGSKFSTLIKLKKANLPVPQTITAVDYKKIKDDLRDKIGYPFILKPSIGGSKGKDVYKIKSETELEKIYKQSKININNFLFQQYIPNNFDIRVIVIGFKAIGAMKRVARKGEFRSNIALGGSPQLFQLSSQLKEISQKAARAVSDEIAGVDIMFNKDQPYIIEVNRTPQFKGFVKATKIQVGKLIAEYAYKKAKDIGLDD